MKKVAILFSAFVLIGFSSCNKCHECHADVNGSEVELGEYCGDEAEDLKQWIHRSNGFNWDCTCCTLW